MCHCFTHLNLCNLVFLMLNKSDATFSIFPPDLSCKFTHFHMHSGSLSFSTMSCVSFKRPHIPADIKRHTGRSCVHFPPPPKPRGSGVDRPITAHRHPAFCPASQLTTADKRLVSSAVILVNNRWCSSEKAPRGSAVAITATPRFKTHFIRFPNGSQRTNGRAGIPPSRS